MNLESKEFCQTSSTKNLFVKEFKLCHGTTKVEYFKKKKKKVYLVKKKIIIKKNVNSFASLIPVLCLINKF